MKNLLAVLTLFTCSILCFSQGGGILNDTLKENGSIYLSQIKIVSNKDYPAFLSDSIRDFKSKLNQDVAEEILRTSLKLRDSLEYLDASIDDGLKINIYFKIADAVINVEESSYKRTTTYSSHLESRPIYIPYSDVKFIRIVKRKDNFFVIFVTKLVKIKYPEFRATKFTLKIKPEADEVTLIASLLYLCNNIKDSGFINY
jgi:hypothetical protein